MKVHKDEPNQTRPVISCRGRILHPLAVWMDHYLQKVSNLQPTFLKSSHTLKDKLIKLQIPPSAKPFTADAVNMYFNIRTGPALREIGTFLHQRSNKYPVPTSALSEALGIITKNNVFQFGDLFFKQLQGTAIELILCYP